jgi:cadmium resistance protein CadD (predicted permease)
MTLDAAGLAGAALVSFVSTDVDNFVLTTTQFATAPAERVRRVAVGQYVGFTILVVAAAAAAAALFDVPGAWIGLLGLVPLTLGVRGLVALGRHGSPATPRWPVAVGGFTTTLITLGSGGDNLAVYIPLFHGTDGPGKALVAAVLLAADVVLVALAWLLGRHRVALAGIARGGQLVTPFIYVVIGVVVLVRAGTFGL